MYLYRISTWTGVRFIELAHIRHLPQLGWVFVSVRVLQRLHGVMTLLSNCSE